MRFIAVFAVFLSFSVQSMDLTLKVQAQNKIVKVEFESQEMSQSTCELSVLNSQVKYAYYGQGEIRLDVGRLDLLPCLMIPGKDFGEVSFAVGESAPMLIKGAYALYINNNFSQIIHIE